MTHCIDTPFWYFNKNKHHGFTLELRGILATPIKTSITIDKITRLQAEFCSELEIELMHSLIKNIVDTTSPSSEVESELDSYTLVAQVLGSTRYETPMMINANDHFKNIALGELYVGDIIDVDIDEIDVQLFITGIFDDSLQAVILNYSNSVFKPFQNLYVRDV